MVLGDPKTFMAEHSEAEPRLVFLKPLAAKPSETNVLITTKSGHEIPLHLLSDGKAVGGEIDFLLDYQRPRSFLVPAAESSFAVRETRALTSTSAPPAPKPEPLRASAQTELLRQMRIAAPKWEGGHLEVAIGLVSEVSTEEMIIPFSVLNNSASAIELLPPQVQLSATTKQQNGKKTKAEQVPIELYMLSFRRLGPGERCDGVLVLERPVFKESSERLLLQIARSDEVDHPVLVPIAFTAPIEGRSR